MAIRPPYEPDDLAFRHGVDGVVGALAVHVGFDLPQQAFDGQLGKDDHVVGGTKRRHELGAIGRGHHRAIGALQRRDRCVIVDRDDQTIPFPACALEVPDVTDVQNVETPVGEGNRAASAAVVLDEIDELTISDDHERPSVAPDPRQS